MANQKFLLILHRLVKECKKDSCSSPAVALVAAGFCNFKTIIMKLSDLKPNEGQIEGVPSNPRTITEDDFEKLKKSLVNFRKMLSLRPMVVDEDWNILGGNMRYQALCRLRDEGVDGFTEDIPDEWVKQDTTLSAAEKREFVIKDNQQRGRNDWDALANEWDDEELREWDVEAAEWFNKDLPDVDSMFQNDNLVQGIEKELGQFQVTFVFSEEHSFVREYCKDIERKKELELKIVELCRQPEVK